MDKHRRQLDASVGASGPPGFAVCDNLTRLLKLRHPPHPAPNVRDDGETPLFRVRDGIALLLFLANQEAKYFFAKGWTRRANQVDGIYQQRHARMFKRLRCRRATIGCYVAPLSSSAKADDPVPRGGPVGQPASRRTGCRAFAGHDRVVTHSAPLDPSPAERVGRVARRERKRTACRGGARKSPHPGLASLRPSLPTARSRSRGRDGNDQRGVTAYWMPRLRGA